MPLAIFWRKGPRSRRSFLNLFYGAQTRPSDLAKVTSFVTTYRDLAVKVGESIDLRAFIADRRAQGEYAVARMVRRSILMFLYREEKVVEGPTLQPRGKIQEVVLADPGVEEAIRRAAELDQALTEPRLEEIRRARRVLRDAWPFLDREPDVTDDLREKAASLEDILKKETFFKELQVIDQHAAALEAAFAKRHAAALAGEPAAA